MTPLDKMRKELADHVYNALYAVFPRYRIINEPNLSRLIESAAKVGVARWAVMCSNGNKVKASERCGINRNTLRDILKESDYMSDLDKYEVAEEKYNKMVKQGYVEIPRETRPTRED